MPRSRHGGTHDRIASLRGWLIAVPRRREARWRQRAGGVLSRDFEAQSRNAIPSAQAQARDLWRDRLEAANPNNSTCRSDRDSKSKTDTGTVLCGGASCLAARHQAHVPAADGSMRRMAPFLVLERSPRLKGFHHSAHLSNLAGKLLEVRRAASVLTNRR